MVRRNTWVTIGVLTILVAVVLLLPRLKAASPGMEATPSAATVRLLDPGLGLPVTIRVTTNGVPPVSLTRSAADSWSVTDPTRLEFDPNQVAAAAGSLLQASVLNNLPVQPPDAAMGLLQPSANILIITDQGKEVALQVGALSPAGSGYYVRIQGKPAVVVNRAALDDVLALPSSGKPPVTPSAPAKSPSATP